MNWYKEDIIKIFILVRDGYIVEELCPDGSIVKLTMDNILSKNGSVEYDEYDMLDGILEYPSIPKKNNNTTNQNNSSVPQSEPPIKNNRGMVLNFESLPAEIKNRYRYDMGKEYHRGDKVVHDYLNPDDDLQYWQIFICVVEYTTGNFKWNHWRNPLTTEEEKLD